LFAPYSTPTSPLFFPPIHPSHRGSLLFATSLLLFQRLFRREPSSLLLLFPVYIPRASPHMAEFFHDGHKVLSSHILLKPPIIVLLLGNHTLTKPLVQHLLPHGYYHMSKCFLILLILRHTE